MKNKKIYIYISPVVVILILSLVFFIMMTNKNETEGAGYFCDCGQPEKIVDKNGTYHYYECPNGVCNYQRAELHDTKYASISESSHRKSCKICGHILINSEQHSWQEQSEGKVNPTCTTNGSAKYKCTACGVTTTQPIPALSHTGGTHTNGGKCTRCNVVYQTHTTTYSTVSENAHKVQCSACGDMGTEGHSTTSTKLTNATCTTADTYKVSCSKCTYSTTQAGNALGHTGGTHTNGGKCTRCNVVYQTHTTTYNTLSETTHQIKCATCGIMGTEQHTTTNKTEKEPTCSSAGVAKVTCSKCTYSTQQPIPATGRHTKDSGTITKQPTCTAQGVKTYKCTGCGTGMGTENISTIPHTEDSGTVTTQPTCTTKGVKIYKCTVCTTVTKTEEVNALNHTGGTHENGGKCTRCNTAYQNHTISYNILSETKHQVKCATCGVIREEGHSTTNTTEKQATCSNPGVTKVTCTKCSYSTQQPIPALNHDGATHANGGKCTRTGCGQVYDAHSKSSTVASYNKAKDGHTPVYKCSNAKCSETYNGTLEQHKITTYTDVKNGTHKGTCTTCAYDVIDSHNYVNNVCDKCNAKKEEAPAECTHTYVAKKDETKHWEECSKCKIVKTNSEKNHTYKYTKASNGKHTAACTGCDYSKSENCTYSGNACTKCGGANPDGQEECTHEYEYTKGTNGKHTATCTKCKDSKTESCTYSGDKCTKCGSTKPAEQEECKHTYEYVKGSNGKHTATCTKCKDSKTENCTYSGDKCAKCGAIKPVEQEECEHDWKIKIDKNYHWFACSKCSEVKEGSKEKHEIEAHKDNKDGTHSGTCTTCKETITVAHTGDDKCDVCGAIIDDNSGNNDGNNNSDNNGDNNNGGNNNGGNNNNDKDDTTIKDDKIPQTGFENGGIIAIIVAVLALGIISIKKFKNYKDIK